MGSHNQAGHPVPDSISDSCLSAGKMQVKFFKNRRPPLGKEQHNHLTLDHAKNYFITDGLADVLLQ